jgi:tRNA-splicing endonuclease subunit Sen15
MTKFDLGIGLGLGSQREIVSHVSWDSRSTSQYMDVERNLNIRQIVVACHHTLDYSKTLDSQLDMSQGQLEPQALSSISRKLQDSENSRHPAHLNRLAVQILHNLQYAHSWTSLTLHTESPENPGALLPRPLVSGIPPQRIYIHPDEQIELLKTGEDGGQRKEREWVLPTHLIETWSLSRFAAIFDAIGVVPPDESRGHGEGKKHKRLLLATLGNDSTVVYYIVHDGLVKPRQN